MTRLTISIIVMIVASAPALAQDLNLGLRLPLTIDADQTTYDGIANTITYKGVRFSQGDISIEAGEGRATLRGQQDAEWTFTGDVVIEVQQGRIECDSADLTFQQSVLTSATVAGSPATYELRRNNAEDATHAQAGRLEYDVSAGIIRFSGNVTITEAGNEIASESLIYNIAERRIDADSSGNGDDRVRITYTPTEGELPVPDVDDENQ